MAQRVLLLDLARPHDAALSLGLARCGLAVDLWRDEADVFDHATPPALAVLRADAHVDVVAVASRLPDAPLLAICAADDEELVAACLRAGAAMVVREPVARLELRARIQALLTRGGNGGGASSNHYALGDLVIDGSQHRVTRAGRPVRLTPTEFRLLTALARRSGRAVSHAELAREALGYDAAAHAEQLRPHVRLLRRKLHDDRPQPRLLVTERGVGYKLAVPAREEAHGR